MTVRAKRPGANRCTMAERRVGHATPGQVPHGHGIFGGLSELTSFPSQADLKPRSLDGQRGGALLSLTHVPNAHGPIQTGRDDLPPIRTKAGMLYDPAVQQGSADGLTGGHIPYLGGFAA